MQKRVLIGFLILFVAVLGMNGCAPGIPDETNHVEPIEESVVIEALVAEEGFYTSPEEVAEYIHLFGKLPGNYLTKKEARDLGWVSEDGNLWEVTDQMSIGGDRFGNREGLLPQSDGRQWFECDANYTGGYRGAERLVFSNDGLVFYTVNHYESFEEIRRIDDEND